MDAITDAITQTQIYATQRKSPIALRLRCVVITTWHRVAHWAVPRIIPLVVRHHSQWLHLANVQLRNIKNKVCARVIEPYAAKTSL